MSDKGSFRNLAVWEKSHRLVLSIYKATKAFPKDELYGLTSQMRRAALSVPANIAEGYKRAGVREKIRFYNIAQASLEELKYFIILSKDLEYIIPDQAPSLAEEVSKMLESYIQKIKQNAAYEPEPDY